MQLGTLIRRLESEADAGEALAAIGDLVLYAEVSAMGTRFEETPPAYAAGAVVRYAAGAGDEEWVTLLGALERDGDPGRVFLTRALRWALADDAADVVSPEPVRQSCGTGGPCGCAHSKP